MITRGLHDKLGRWGNRFDKGDFRIGEQKEFNWTKWEVLGRVTRKGPPRMTRKVMEVKT